MNSKYYTAKYEVVFMYVVLNDLDILKRILELVLERNIEEIVVLNPNLLTDHINSRIQKLDLLITSNKEYINIELNSSYGKLTKMRNLLYAFKVVLSQAEKGKEIYDLDNKTIQININFNSKGKEKEVWRLCDLRSKQPVTDFLTIFNIYVDLYVKKYYNNGKKFSNGEEIIIMLGLNKEELAELAERSEIVMRYKKLVDKVNEDKSLFRWFSQEEEREMYETALIKQSKEEGLIEGKQAGLIEGKKTGEMKKALTIAKNMLNENMNIDLIAKLTNLTKKQIEKLL